MTPEELLRIANKIVKEFKQSGIKPVDVQQKPTPAQQEKPTPAVLNFMQYSNKLFVAMGTTDRGAMILQAAKISKEHKLISCDAACGYVLSYLLQNKIQTSFAYCRLKNLPHTFVLLGGDQLNANTLVIDLWNEKIQILTQANFDSTMKALCDKYQWAYSKTQPLVTQILYQRMLSLPAPAAQPQQPNIAPIHTAPTQSLDLSSSTKVPENNIITITQPQQATTQLNDNNMLVSGIAFLLCALEYALYDLLKPNASSNSFFTMPKSTSGTLAVMLALTVANFILAHLLTKYVGPILRSNDNAPSAAPMHPK